ARSFAIALADAAAELRAPDPIPLPGPGMIDFDPHPTEIRPAPQPPPPAASPAGPPGALPSALGSPLPEAPPTVPPDQPLVAIPVYGPPAQTRSAQTRPAQAPEAKRRSTGWRPQRVVPIVVLVVLLLAAGTAAFAAASASGPRTRVPNLVGSTEKAAREAAKQAGVAVRTRAVPADDPAGTVVGQSPAPGTLLGAHHAVTLQLSAGPPPVNLPKVTGETEASARAVLDAAGFVVSSSRRTDEDIAAGHVVEQQPSAEQAAPGSEIHLVISDGPAPVEVPNVVGKSYDEAVKTLTAKRFKVTRQDEYSDTVPAGQVIRHDPVKGAEAPRDSTVTVVVSRGPDVVTVDDYRGMTVEDAVIALEQAGLQADVVSYRPFRRVKQQDPPAGTQVRRNETVTLYL
ncbi:MAG: PASTA domain-containing protein, partial [Acidimicrobiia bacterium]